jgi:hypothetical protein
VRGARTHEFPLRPERAQGPELTDAVGHANREAAPVVPTIATTGCAAKGKRRQGQCAQRRQRADAVAHVPVPYEPLQHLHLNPQLGRAILQQPNLRQDRTRELILRKPQERQALATLACLLVLTALRTSFVLVTALATLACLLALVSEFPDPSQAAKASLTKLPDPS